MIMAKKTKPAEAAIQIEATSVMDLALELITRGTKLISDGIALLEQTAGTISLFPTGDTQGARALISEGEVYVAGGRAMLRELAVKRATVQA